MQEPLAFVDLPLLVRSHAAHSIQDDAKVRYWNDYALACRETAELKATDVAMGNALMRLLKTLEVSGLEPAEADRSFVTAFALAASVWHIDAHAASNAYVWSWLENQVAATKLVPLGQSAAQRLLLSLTEHVPAVVAIAATVDDDDIGASLPSLALASAWH